MKKRTTAIAKCTSSFVSEDSFFFFFFFSDMEKASPFTCRGPRTKLSTKVVVVGTKQRALS